jgi:integrase
MPGWLRCGRFIITRRWKCQSTPRSSSVSSRSRINGCHGRSSEIEAILASVDQSTRLGRRNHAFLLLAVQTGLRLSEITMLRRRDVALGAGAHVRCDGKGRKERCTPLTKPVVAALRAWMQELGGDDDQPLFPSSRGGRLSADAVQHLVKKQTKAARVACPSLATKRVTPHVLRHTAAMELLQAGVDRAMIAIWLGHESLDTTQIYLDANLALKQAVLAKTHPVMSQPGKYRPDDQLLSFLKGL